MKSYLITFRSVTYAQRALGIMEREGIRAVLRRTPRWMEERGCGYAVEAKLAEIGMALGLLRQQQIPYRKCYRMTQEGGVEEL